MSECTHDCSTCGESCAERKEVNVFEKKPLHEGCRVHKVYGVVSGKGGVGKSMVTCQLAVALRREGYRTAILDADITGPSIPKAFGIHGRAAGTSDAIIPVTTATGIQLMSVNLLLEHETDPVIWRGPVIGGVVQQFWSDVLWDDVDYMFVDMPPGTGDVALNVFQSLPVDGVIIVASPQELVSMVVQKAVKMAQMMNIPIVGLVENMSYVQKKETALAVSFFIYFISCSASVTRPLTPTAIYTTCRATSPDIRRLRRIPIHNPASTQAMPKPAVGSSAGLK